MWLLGVDDEELGLVGVGATVCHRYNSTDIMLKKMIELIFSSSFDYISVL
jgi:hypothetical protein